MISTLTSRSFSYVPDWADEHNSAMPPNAPVVDLYARLSRNVLGELEKIEDQIDDGRAQVLSRRRWRVGMVHVDNSLSAWRKGVRRPGWERLLERLESRAVAGAGVYHQDRLMRQPRDLERLIDLADNDGILLASAHGERDLTNPDDRFILRIEVAHACRSSDDTSRRRKFRNKAVRERGRLTGGPRSFGFPGIDRTAEPLPDGARPRVSAAQVQAERAAIRNASERVAAGVSLWTIAQEWNAAGLRTSTGAEWGHITVRQVLSRARNAGRIEHDGVVVGRIADEGPIVDEELFERVQAVFAGRRRGRAPSGQYIGSGLVYCGECGHPLTGRPAGKWASGNSRAREYYCMKMRGGCNRLSVNADGLDAELRTFTIERLSDPEYTDRLSKIAREHAQRAEEITTELNKIKGMREALAGRLGRQELEEFEYNAFREPLVARDKKLRAELEALALDDPATAQAHQRAHRDEVAAQWDAPDADRRAMLQTALRGFRVEINRADPKAPRKFDRRRVAIKKV